MEERLHKKARKEKLVGISFVIRLHNSTLHDYDKNLVICLSTYVPLFRQEHASMLRQCDPFLRACDGFLRQCDGFLAIFHHCILRPYPPVNKYSEWGKRLPVIYQRIGNLVRYNAHAAIYDRFHMFGIKVDELGECCFKVSRDEGSTGTHPEMFDFPFLLQYRQLRHSVKISCVIIVLKEERG